MIQKEDNSYMRVHEKTSNVIRKAMKQLIINYVTSYNFMNAQYVLNIFQNNKIEDILSAIHEILESKEKEDIHDVLTFIRDICIYNAIEIPRELVDRFRKKIVEVFNYDCALSNLTIIMLKRTIW